MSSSNGLMEQLARALDHRASFDDEQGCRSARAAAHLRSMPDEDEVFEQFVAPLLNRLEERYGGNSETTVSDQPVMDAGALITVLEDLEFRVSLEKWRWIGEEPRDYGRGADDATAAAVKAINTAAAEIRAEVESA